MKVHSNTIIECLNDECGFFMADYKNRPILTNSCWSLKERKTRNITIIGGTYNHNCTKQAHSVPIEEYPMVECESLKQGYALSHPVYLMEFYGVENFNLKNVLFKNQRTYTFTMGNFKNVNIEDSIIDMAEHVHPSNQDGFHFFGPGQFLTMKNLRGCTGDDFINLAPDEMDDVSSITDVLIDGVFFDDVCQGIRMLSHKDGLLDRVTVRNITGTYRTFAFDIIPFYEGTDFGNVGDLFFENIDLRQLDATYHYTPLHFFGVGGNIKSLTLKNVRFHSPVRNSCVFDVGRPFFYRPDSLTEEECKKYCVNKNDFKPKDWMPEGKTPVFQNLIIDGLTITSDEKADDTQIIELRHRIDNAVIKNVNVFRSESAQKSGHLIKLFRGAKVKNLIIEDVFAEKLGSVFSAEEESFVDLLRADNITLKNGEKLFDVDKARIKTMLESFVNML